MWLSGRLRALLEPAATSGKLRRVFVWGSFVTAKPAGCRRGARRFRFGARRYRDPNRLAQQCIVNLRRILLEARKIHSRQDYARMAKPILIEVQQREQEILEYLSRDLEPVTN